jgi:deoxyadenosine/deoxycytidine kinase
LERIRRRGRSIEMGKETEKYLRFLYEGYDNWFYSSYKASPSIVVDVSKRKVNDDFEDQEWLLSEIRKYIA